MITLTTNRLILRPLRYDDIYFVTSLLGDENRTRYLFGGTTMDNQEAAAFIKLHFTAEDASTGLGVLCTKVPECLAGFAGIIPTDCLGSQDMELGFVLSQKADGNGYATEIGHCQMRYAFETLHLPRILALAHPENSASVHVLRDKLQMTEVMRIGRTAHRGPRIVFCRYKDEDSVTGTTYP